MTESTENKKGLSIRTLDIFLIVIAVAVALVLLYFSFISIRSYSSLRSANDLYLESRLDAAYMQEASDYLTEKTRLFVITGDRQALDDYFYEVDVTKRREYALEDMETYLKGTDVYSYLEKALEHSNELSRLELYAMRLVIKAKGYDITEYPEALQQLTLAAVYEKLSNTQLMQRAQELAFGDNYDAYKQAIDNDMTRCTDRLIEMTKEAMDESSVRYQRNLTIQTVLLVVLIAITLAIVIITSFLLIFPLERDVALVQEQKTLPIEGARELQIFAAAYNKALLNSKDVQEKLSYDASHDPLTGLLNRSEFEKIRVMHEKRKSALMLIDVDYFKSVNDTYGHDMGDTVLKRVASLLDEAFRSEDYVFRIGGDEFAVIMVHVDDEHEPIISEKIGCCNDQLQNPPEGMPCVSLSVGVAFKDMDREDQDMYKDADLALYKVKERGRNGIAFFRKE